MLSWAKITEWAVAYGMTLIGYLMAILLMYSMGPIKYEAGRHTYNLNHNKHIYGGTGARKTAFINRLRKIANIIRDLRLAHNEEYNGNFTDKQCNPVIQNVGAWPDVALEIQRRDGQGLVIMDEQSTCFSV